MTLCRGRNSVLICQTAVPVTTLIHLILEAAMKTIFACALPALLCAMPALANDGIAGVSAGGIVFRKTDAIAMKKEVLTVSHSLISVDYEFVNESAREVEETIVFPLPTYHAAVQGSGTYYGQPNGFSILVDGKPVSFTTRLVALLDGEDVTARLKSVGLSDAQIAYSRAFAPGVKTPPWTARQSQQLAKLLLADDGPDGFGPVWQVQVNYVWKQKFPAGRVVRVHHEYRPFVEDGPAAWGIEEGFAKTYCADKTFLSAWNKLALPEERRAAQYESRSLPAKRVSYILRTGNTWKRGIEDFTLNVVKRNPAELISLCFPGTFKKLDANTFQVHLTNFQPSDDLHVYFGNVESADAVDSDGVMPALKN